MNTKHPKDIEKHASARRLAKCEFKKSQFDYYYKLNLKLMEKETSSKAWWKLNKRELGQNQRASIPSLIVDNVVLNDNVDKCTALNRFFAEQCNLSVPFPSTQFLSNEKAKIENQTLPEIEEFRVSQYEIKEILKSVNVNKSSGSDKLGNIILKKCSDVISLPLSIIFNQSLIDSVFPLAWKMVDVCPIFKKDDPQLCSNYRPISLLSPTSKILERLVF